MDLSCLNLNDLNPSEVLESFPGIWFVTIPDGSLVVAASENYWQKACGNWRALPPTKLPNGFVINWLVRPLLSGEKAMMYLQKAFTVAAAPEKITAREACVYGRGPHALWCQEGLVLDRYRAYFSDNATFVPDAVSRTELAWRPTI